MILSQQDINFYNKNKYLVIENFLSDQILTEYTQHITTLEKQGFKNFINKQPTYPVYFNEYNRPRKIEQLVTYSPKILDLYKEHIQPVINEIFGTETVLFKDRAVMKYKDNNGIGAHTDDVNMLHFVKRIISAGICITDQTKENGCLEVYNVDAISEMANVTGCAAPCMTGGPCACIQEIGDKDTDKKSKFFHFLEVPKGSVILLDGTLLHQSGINKTRSVRTLAYTLWNSLEDGDHYRNYYEYMEKHKNKDFSAPGADWDVYDKPYYSL